MNALREVQNLLDQIRGRINDPIVDKCSNQIEVLCRAHLTPVSEFLSDVRFRPAERRILDLLYSKIGKTVSKDAILDAAAFDKLDEPSPGILGVHFHNIRYRMRRASAPYHIESDYGIGYRLVEGPYVESGNSSAKFRMAA